MDNEKLRLIVFNLVCMVFDKDGNYKGIDTVDFIDDICEETGMTKQEYTDLILKKN